MLLLSEKISHLQYLQELDISNNNLSDKSIELSSINFNSNKELKILNISCNCIKLSSTIIKLTKCINIGLEKFNFSNNILQIEKINSLLENLSILSNLRVLNMSNTNICDLTVDELSNFLSIFKELEILDISSNNFADVEKIKIFILQNYCNTLLYVII